MNKILLYIIFILFSSSFPIFSHGRDIETGENGFGVDALLSASEDLFSYGFSAWYSYYGIMDFDFYFIKSFLEDDIKSTMVEPVLNINIFKQDRHYPLNFSLSCSLSEISFDSDYYDDERLDVKLYSIAPGFSLSRNIFLDERFILQPLFVYASHFNRFQIKKYDELLEEKKDITGKYSGIISFIMKTGRNAVKISPGIAYYDKTVSFDFKAGLISKL